MNLVALIACPFVKPCAVIVTTIGSVAVIAVGMNCRYVKWLNELSGVAGNADSGCSSIKSYNGLNGSCGFGPLPGGNIMPINIFTKFHLTIDSEEKQGIYMAKGLNEKSIRISAKPPKKEGIVPSFVEGAKQSKVARPKSLTPLKGSSKKR
jgi:hypothetical protein